MGDADDTFGGIDHLIAACAPSQNYHDPDDLHSLDRHVGCSSEELRRGWYDQLAAAVATLETPGETQVLAHVLTVLANVQSEMADALAEHRLTPAECSAAEEVVGCVSRRVTEEVTAEWNRLQRLHEQSRHPY